MVSKELVEPCVSRAEPQGWECVIITKLIASEIYFCKEFLCNNFGRDGSLEKQCSWRFHGFFRGLLMAFS